MMVVKAVVYDSHHFHPHWNNKGTPCARDHSHQDRDVSVEDEVEQLEELCTDLH